MGDIGMIKGVACLVALAGRGRRRRSRSQGHQHRSRGLPERRGGRNSKYKQTDTRQEISSARGVLTRYYTIPVKGDNIRESFPEVWHFRIDEPEGKGSMFAMLGACDR